MKIVISALEVFITRRRHSCYGKSRLLDCKRLKSSKGFDRISYILVGTYPQSTDFFGYKLVNRNLTVCLDFNPNYTTPNPKPLVCHPIKESDMPSTPNSTIDAGYFIIPSNLNESHGYVHVKIKYQGIGVGEGGLNGGVRRMDMGDTICPEVIVNISCIENHHFKPGTPQFHDCYEALS